VCAAFLARRETAWLSLWSAAAAAAALTRPDGLLLVAATVFVTTFELWRRKRPLGRALLGLLPLAAVAGHVLWRRAFYGEWLPNTYYAKVTAPWPEAGWRYVYCFAVEHAAWLWAAIAIGWLAFAVARGTLAPRRLVGTHLPATTAVLATCFHVGYYTLRVGGDHFEYRVFSHLVPLLVLSAAAMVLSMFLRRWPAAVALVALALASGVGWLHFALVAQRQPPQYDSLSAKLPSWAQPLLREYDRHQAWLHLQFNCMRCDLHQQSVDGIVAVLPPRARTPGSPDDILVTKSVAVGLVAWMLPDIAVIDLLGLCDRVIARTPLANWNAPYLPREVLHAALGAADGNGDGFCSVDELRATFAGTPGFSAESAQGFVDLMVLLFAYARRDGLLAAEAAAIEQFFANLRWIAHERQAPPDYVAALDPNVTIENRAVVVRRRAVPLTAERVRTIEAEWMQRVLAEQKGK
jgi:hypothetical protein